MLSLKRSQDLAERLEGTPSSKQYSFHGISTFRTTQSDELPKEEEFMGWGDQVESIHKRSKTTDNSRNEREQDLQGSLVSQMAYGAAYKAMTIPKLLLPGPSGSSQSPQSAVDLPNHMHLYGKHGQEPLLQNYTSLPGTCQREVQPFTSLYGFQHLPSQHDIFPAVNAPNSFFSQNITSSTPRSSAADFMTGMPLLPVSFLLSMEARMHAARVASLELLALSFCRPPQTGKSASYAPTHSNVTSMIPPHQHASCMVMETSLCKSEKERLIEFLDQTLNTEWQAPKALPAILAVPNDRMKLSHHQILLRHQIEAFEATKDDVMTHTRGRNKPITLGQVGIRCRHCAHLPVAKKQKGSAYFPATLLGLYQAAQNMNTTHMQCGLCDEMPVSIKHAFALLMSTKSSSSGTGRHYWAQGAKQLGLVDTDEGIRFKSAFERDYESANNGAC